jgi:hypothetical protein
MSKRHTGHMSKRVPPNHPDFAISVGIYSVGTEYTLIFLRFCESISGFQKDQGSRTEVSSTHQL